ncbi:MAG: 1-acyl-sn-glycerol-3-phosphate acyltransferase [Planctomycetes bacterium]|nr:1-acyl-sn-glycerol-3-phosphate acyltransferase [Planctomycetota bacterium]
MLRAAWFWTWLLCWTLFVCALYSLALLPPRVIFRRREEAFTALVRLWARGVLAGSGVRSEMSDLERLPPGPAVIAANHASWLDVWLLLKHTPRNIRFAAKRQLFYVPVIGWLMALSGHVSLTRGDRDQDLRALEKVKARLLRDHLCIFWFPEGTRSADGRLQPFKKGLFHFALDMKIPVAPIVIHGTFDLMPRSRWSPRPGQARGEALEPISTEGLTVDDKDRFMARLEETFRRALAAE